MKRLAIVLVVLSLALAFACPKAYAAEGKDDAWKSLQDQYNRLNKMVRPAVVGIATLIEKKGKITPPRTRRSYFGRLPVAFDAYGSGIVISENGYILTSMAVVPENAKKITVFFPSGRKCIARVIGLSKINNVALIKIERCGLKFLKLGDSSTVKPGQFAMTFGSPFFATLIDGATVCSKGTISGIYRSHGLGKYRGMAFETSATVRGGSDGGPLVNSAGEVVGILDLAETKNKWLGLAIPINQIKAILPELKKGKDPGFGFFGVKYGLLDKTGEIRVAAVKKGSSADKAGVRKDDVIIRFCGVEVDDFRELTEIMEGLPAASRFTLIVRRGGSERLLRGRLQKWPAGLPRPGKKITTPVAPSGQGGFLGIKFNEQAPDGKGAIVLKVKPDSPASRAGLKSGDRIVKYAGTEIGGYKELVKIVGRLEPLKPYKVRIMRKMSDGAEWGKTVKIVPDRREDYD